MKNNKIKIHNIFQMQREQAYKKFVDSKQIMSVREYNESYGFCDPEYHNGLVIVYDGLFHIEIESDGFHLCLGNSEYKILDASELPILEDRLFDWVVDHA